jgi:hypothetical protein
MTVAGNVVAGLKHVNLVADLGEFSCYDCTRETGADDGNAALHVYILRALTTATLC